MRLVSAYLALLASLPIVFGHGQVHNFITSQRTYAAADAYASADPTSPLRKLNTYGPAADFTSPTITCGVRIRQYLIAILLTTHIHKTQEGGNTPVSALAEVQAGELVTFDWGDWSSVHDGYALFFLLRRSMR